MSDTHWPPHLARKQTNLARNDVFLKMNIENKPISEIIYMIRQPGTFDQNLFS